MARRECSKVVALLQGEGFSDVQSFDKGTGRPGVRLLLARNDRTGARHFIKIWACSTCVEQRQGLLEAYFLKLVHGDEPCPYITPLHDVLTDGRHMCLVLPYASGGDLCKLVLENPTGIGQSIARRWFRDMAFGLFHLHSRNIAHGDVCLEHVVLSRCSASPTPSSSSSKHTARLIDFSVATVVQPDQHYAWQGKLGYCPAEVWRGMGDELSVTAGGPPSFSAESVDPFKVDVWCLALCLYNMLTGRQLFVHPSEVTYQWLAEGRAFEVLCHHRVKFGLPIPKLARGLIAAMLQPDPASRLTVRQVLDHPYVANVSL